nr:MAG TPA: hypothetical protein [Caudoviricetes sp.]
MSKLTFGSLFDGSRQCTIYTKNRRIIGTVFSTEIA